MEQDWRRVEAGLEWDRARVGAGLGLRLEQGWNSRVGLSLEHGRRRVEPGLEQVEATPWTRNTLYNVHIILLSVRRSLSFLFSRLVCVRFGTVGWKVTVVSRRRFSILIQTIPGNNNSPDPTRDEQIQSSAA